MVVKNGILHRIGERVPWIRSRVIRFHHPSTKNKKTKQKSPVMIIYVIESLEKGKFGTIH